MAMILVLVFFYPIMTFSQSLTSFDWRNANLGAEYFNAGELSKEWTAMSAEEALNYYTPLEVCELYDLPNMGKDIDCSVYDKNEKLDRTCMAHTPANDIHVRGSCGKNLGAKARFHKTTPKSKNIGNVLNLMKSHGSNTILMIGDSVTEQSTWDASCGLQRLGFTIKYYCTQSRRDESCEMTDERDVLHTPSFRIEYPIKGNNETILNAHVPYFNIKRIKVEMTGDYKHDMISYFASSVNTTGKLLIIFNTGLFYNMPLSQSNEYREKYKNEASEVIKSLAIHAKNHTILFRETSAQHFRSNTGLYYSGMQFGNADNEIREIQKNLTKIKNKHQNKLTDEIRDTTLDNQNDDDLSISSTSSDSLKNSLHEIMNDFYSCQPIQSKLNNWRNDVLHEIVNELKVSHSVGIIPFFNITAPRYELHTQFGYDCTHFCKSPMLWLPMWEEIFHHLKKRTRHLISKNTLRGSESSDMIHAHH